MIPVKIFISYSHKDEEFKDSLITHLSPLKRRGLIKEWHDRIIIPGEEWDKNIKQELLNSNIILLLISSDFISSDYCYDTEVKKAIELHEQGTSIVIPIILRDCDWKSLPFGKIQGLPKDCLPLTKWKDRDEAYLNIITGLKSIIENRSSTVDHDKKTIESDEFLTFSVDTIINRLPRGYILIQDFDYKDYNQWDITAHYYNYAGNLGHGTHYHESYRNRWETTQGQDTQCIKLGIPKGDWNYALNAFYLIIRLRHRQKNQDPKEIMDIYSGKNDFFNYYHKDEKIKKPTIPDSFLKLERNGEIRDIIEELSIESWQNYDLQTLHVNFESIRRKAYLFLFERLEKNNPALIFVKEIVDQYKPEYNLENLVYGAKN